MDDLFISYNLFIRSIELTEKSTIRYRNLGSVVGINFYFNFLTKLIKLQSFTLYKDLILKVTKKIF